jgi:muramoyltetrapeptide carboxypeptidase
MSIRKKSNLIVPPLLKPGDTIGIATPASPFQKEAFQAGVRILKQWGFKVSLGRKVSGSRGYLSGTDRERAEELMALFADPGIHAVLCSRGGYGSMRILDFLDFNKIKDHPKLFMGFSDITALLSALWEKCGLLSFHGPMVTTLNTLAPSSLIRVLAVLQGNYGNQVPLNRKKAFGPESTQGVMIGGNLTMLTHLIGTSYEPTWDRTLLFLEDCSEDPYRVDRLFTHLKLRGCLDRVNAILLGTFTGSNKKPLPLGLFKEIFRDTNVPVWTGLPVGHGSRNIPLPIGAPAIIDAERGFLSVDLEFEK